MDNITVNTEIANTDSFDGLGMFADLVSQLGTSTKTNDKLRALLNYFETAEDKDKVWVIISFCTCTQQSHQLGEHAKSVHRLFRAICYCFYTISHHFCIINK